MIGQREAITTIVNAVRSAGLPLTAWYVDGGALHLLLAGGQEFSALLEGDQPPAPSSIVTELLRSLGWPSLPVTVRAMDEIAELTPTEAARWRFVRWLISTGRISGDTTTALVC